MLTRDQHLFGPGPKRILSLDGGGVRGLVTLGVLARIEKILRERMPTPQSQKNFRLSQYFDLIGGTSTGAIIATLLALGYEVDEIATLYKDLAPRIFGKARWFNGAGVKSKFDKVALKTAVESTLSDFLRRSGRNPDDIDVLRLHSDHLQTGLAIVAKRMDTGSAWLLTNNPRAKFWDPQSHVWKEHFDELGYAPAFFPNSDYTLSRLIRASASAPFYLDGISLDISPGVKGFFLDGGASPFNNPAQELFLATTLKAFGPYRSKTWNEYGASPHGFNWPTGAENIFLMSVGTGTWRLSLEESQLKRMSSLRVAKEALLSILDDCSKSAITWLQALSESPRASKIDGLLEEMHGLRLVQEPLLTFRRVSPVLAADELKRLDASLDFPPSIIVKSRELDNASSANLERLAHIGRVAGERLVDEDDLLPIFDLPEMRRPVFEFKVPELR